MTERPKGGPIRRKAGARRAEREARRSTLQSQLKSSPGASAPKESVETIPPTPLEPVSPVEKAVVGRRVFDPGGTPRAPTPKPKAAAKPERKAEVEAPVAVKTSPEELVRQQEAARELSVDKGIPQVHALRVIRGEVSLEIVLKSLMRKERATQLIVDDGLEPGLAGQVASGHLSRERALELQRIRMVRKERIDRDALKLAELSEAEVAVGCFDGSWFIGKVAEARTYDVDFVLSEGGETRLVQKHDVKLVCPAEVVALLRKGEMFEEPVREVGLAGTADRSERVRPTDARLLQLIDERSSVTCLLRDGSSYLGIVRSFGRWDMTMDIEGAGEVTVLFHALHKANTWAI